MIGSNLRLLSGGEKEIAFVFLGAVNLLNDNNCPGKIGMM